MATFTARLLMAVAGFVLSANAAAAVDVNEATFSWIWTPGGGATHFRLKCQRGLGVLPTVIVPITLRSYPVQDVIGGPGDYRCVITAAHATGESAPSAPVFFRRRGHEIISE